MTDEFGPWNVDVGIEVHPDRFILYEMDKDLGIMSWDHGSGLGMEASQYDFRTEEAANKAADKIRTWLEEHGYKAAPPSEDIWEPKDGYTVSVALIEDEEDD